MLLGFFERFKEETVGETIEAGLKSVLAELSASSWLVASVQLDLIFDVPASQMWETAIRRLGVDPSMLQMGSGIH